MKLPELKELAKQLGLRGVSTMRKGELVATLHAARTGGEAPAGVTVRRRPAEKAAKKAPDKAADKTVESPALLLDEITEKPRRAARAAAKTASAAEPETQAEPKEQPAAKPVSNMEMEVTARRVRKRRGASAAGDDRRADDLLDSLDLRGDRPARRGRRQDAEAAPSRRPASKEKPQDEAIELDEILDTLPVAHNDRENRRSRGNDRGNGRARRSRGHEGNDQESRQPQQRDDAVMVAGVVDVLDSYAFIRTSGYLPGPNDVYVSMGQVKKYGLRKGDAVKGTIRAPHDNDRRNQRQKFVPLQSIDEINGMSVEEAMGRPHFSKLTPLYPNERLRQETTPNRLTGRLIDIVAPIGKGQRGLIVSPPKAGKTITLQNIANAIATNNPEVHLMVVLVDERPEEVTDMERTVQGEVISSTFDRPASDHTMVAELAIERAKRLVELGQDVVVLLDSMTRLARAYNIAAPASGRILSGGVDAQALYPPKKFFGAARNIENGGSLTIISSALVETGSKMDEVIFEEFKGTGNMELRLSRELADKRMFPAVDINASGTRREELITDPHELPLIYRLRRLLGGLEPEQAYQTIVPRLKKTASNHDFFASLVQQNGGGSSSAQ